MYIITIILSEMKGVVIVITEAKDCCFYCCCNYATSPPQPPPPPSRFVGLTLKRLRRSSVKRRWGFALEVGGVNSQWKKLRQSSEEELTQLYQGNPNDQ